MGSQYNVNGYMHLVQYINKSLLNIITRIETSNLHNIISPETIIQYFKHINLQMVWKFSLQYFTKFGIFKGPFGKEPEKIKPLFSTN